MKLSGKNIIGNHLSAGGEVSFKAVDPATNEPLEGDFFEATDEEINDAILQAECAIDDYNHIPYTQRADFLESIADAILDLGDQLINRCMAETALPEARLIGERGRTMNQLKLFASVLREGSWLDARIDTAIPDRQPLPKPDIRQMQVPLGPVGVFGASNFPLAFSVAGGDTVSALAAGCPVVFKAHPLHPGTSEMVGAAIQSAIKKTGMPEGVFSLVHGQTTRTGMHIVRHPFIKAIGFTGSFAGGKAIFDAANQRHEPIPVFAEMGSINPVFILPRKMKSETENVVSGLIASVNLGVGQFCTSPGLVVGLESDSFTKYINAQSGDLEAGIMLSDKIRENYHSGIARFLKINGVEVIGKGKDSIESNHATFNALSTPGDVFLQHQELAAEVFGPSTLYVRARDKKQMMEIAGAMAGHLTATIQGLEEELAEYADLIRILEKKVGRLLFNGYPTGVEVCHSMVHGGPYPATTASQTTSVGTAAIRRFTRPICYQNFPQETLPTALKDGNPLNIWRMVNGEIGKH